MVILANKSDLKHGETGNDEQMLQEMTSHYNVRGYLTSAKLNLNLSRPFKRVIMEVLKDATQVLLHLYPFHLVVSQLSPFHLVVSQLSPFHLVVSE